MVSDYNGIKPEISDRNTWVKEEITREMTITFQIPVERQLKYDILTRDMQLKSA